MDGNVIVKEIEPGPRDLVVRKEKPSGFFGSPLQSYLQNLGCDSVIVTGTTTSGCVRATVIDAFSLNFRTTVVEDGCFDRSQASHAINLCDMNAKYANVMPSDEVLEYLAHPAAGHVRPAVRQGHQEGRGLVLIPPEPPEMGTAADLLYGSVPVPTLCCSHSLYPHSPAYRYPARRAFSR